jgi:hypothetical protein
MIYALSAIGLLIGFLIWIWIWSMCRIAAKYDENFEPINQREEPIAQHDRTGTDELGLSDLTPVVGNNVSRRLAVPEQHDADRRQRQGDREKAEAM